MFELRHGATALGLAGLLLAQAGCLGPMAAVPTSTVAALPAAPPSHDELPKDKALSASLTYAESLDKAGSDEAAIEQYEKVLRLAPEHPAATRRLAVLYDRTADFTKSEAAYRKLAKSHPRDADLFCDWGYSYYLRNNWREAEAKLRRALELDKKHARARCNLGLVLGQEDRFAEAFQMFRDAGLDEADAHCDLAFVYWTKGKNYYDHARRECLLARQLNPASSKARELIAMLDEAQKPQSDKPVAKAPERTPVRAPAALPQNPSPTRPAVSEGQTKYQLPAGWAPVTPKQNAPATLPSALATAPPIPATPRTAPATPVAVPPAPRGDVTEATVTFE
jgi:tetratricopeptide (TPR) repeat protein